MIDVVLLPGRISAERLSHSQVVVLDVLRATSTAVTALANGAREVRLFDDVQATCTARAGVDGPVVLGGERHCVKIAGFDVGNSPAEYATEVLGGATVLLTTTNGTRAAVEVAASSDVFLGCLLNASATARALLGRIQQLDTLLVCAGTDGDNSIEDIIGAGAIIWQLRQLEHSLTSSFADTAWIAYETFAAARQDLAAALRLGRGGIQLIEAGLADDIDWCARVDSRPIVARVLHAPLRAVRDELRDRKSVV